jgi:hypothetical protein
VAASPRSIASVAVRTVSTFSCDIAHPVSADWTQYPPIGPMG